MHDFGGEPSGKRPLRIWKQRWSNNIYTDLKELQMKKRVHCKL